MSEDTLLDCIEEDTLQTADISSNKIKHMVCSGGGSFGFIAYGIFKQSCMDGFWKIEDIESMYGTSIGAVICLLLSLLRGENGLTWDLLDNYLITRPWQNVFKIDFYTITNSLQNGGILNKEAIEDVFIPLFKTLDVPKNLTLKDHYNKFGIELHVYSTELESMELVDISYKSHPDMCIVDAVYASCSLPLLFSPYIRENKTYFDGGLFCNYPLYFCIQNTQNNDEIMGIKWVAKSPASTQNTNTSFSSDDGDDTKTMQTTQSTLFDYILNIFKNLTTKINDYEPRCKIKYEFDIQCSESTLYEIYLAIMQSEKRRQMIDEGIVFWRNNSTVFPKYK
jgi:predicted acylesterase/phospholipase RssA